MILTLVMLVKHMSKNILQENKLGCLVFVQLDGLMALWERLIPPSKQMGGGSEEGTTLVCGPVVGLSALIGGNGTTWTCDNCAWLITVHVTIILLHTHTTLCDKNKPMNFMINGLKTGTFSPD